jgi:hypothetical protein
MAHQCHVGPARGQWDRVNVTGPPAANFTSATDTDSTSRTDISSSASLGKVGFKTLDAQAYFSYDLNFAGKPDEWICRNMMSDCVLQGPDSNKRTIVEIFNYEHKLGGAYNKNIHFHSIVITFFPRPFPSNFDYISF